MQKLKKIRVHAKLKHRDRYEKWKANSATVPCDTLQDLIQLFFRKTNEASKTLAQTFT